MIRVGKAIRFLGRAEGGKSRPPRCLIEFSDGTNCEAYVKIPGLAADLTASGLGAEFASAIVAGHLGLPICEPILVELDDLYVPEEIDSELSVLIENTQFVVFGSKKAQDGYHELTIEDRFAGKKVNDLLAIYGFDTLLENNDRGVMNPNLLIMGENILIIDHELCFPRSTAQFYFAPKPWQLGATVNYDASANQHALASRLKPKKNIDVDGFVASWQNLDLNEVEKFVNKMPVEWGNGLSAEIMTNLRDIQSHMLEFKLEIERVVL